MPAMSTPAWILEIIAVVMLVVAEVSAGQLVAARAWTRRGGTGAGIAVSQLLTGIALAGVLVAGLSALPNAVWEVVFAVLTAWFAWCLWRESQGGGAAAVARGRYAPHLVYSAAMLYLFAALPGSSVAGQGTSTSGTGGMAGMAGMAGGSSGGTPALHASTLALIFALLLIAFTVHNLDRSVPAGFALAATAAGTAAPRQPAQAARLLSPALVNACQVAISVSIAFILIIMI